MDDEELLEELADEVKFGRIQFSQWERDFIERLDDYDDRTKWTTAQREKLREIYDEKF